MPRTLAAAAAAIVVLPICAPAAFAADATVKWSPKNIQFASYTANHISGYVESGTTYMPLWYVLQALKQSGYTYSFNGSVLNITSPSGVSVNDGDLQVGSGNVSIEINGQLVKRVQTEVRHDGGYGVLTQYVPIYYIQQILSALSFYNAWDGTTWTGQPILASLNGNTSVREGKLDAFALDLKDKNEHAFIPNGSVTWSVSGYGDASIDNATGIFSASLPGTYQVTASVDGFHLTKQVQVFGSAVGVRLTASTTGLLADGAATKTITAQAVDAQGNVVQDFMGQVTLSIPSVGGSFDGGIVSDSGDNQVVVPLYNGAGTATLTAPTWNPSSYETITSSNLTSIADVLPTSPTYGWLDVSYTTPVVSGIQITDDRQNLYSDGIANLHVTLIDAAGNPVTYSASPVNVTFTLSGPGSFTDGQTQTTYTTYVYPGSNALTIPVYAVSGQQGTVTVSATGDGGVSGTATFGSNE